MNRVTVPRWEAWSELTCLLDREVFPQELFTALQNRYRENAANITDATFAKFSSQNPHLAELVRSQRMLMLVMFREVLARLVQDICRTPPMAPSTHHPSTSSQAEVMSTPSYLNSATAPRSSGTMLGSFSQPSASTGANQDAWLSMRNVYSSAPTSGLLGLSSGPSPLYNLNSHGNMTNMHAQVPFNIMLSTHNNGFVNPQAIMNPGTQAATGPYPTALPGDGQAQYLPDMSSSSSVPAFNLGAMQRNDILDEFNVPQNMIPVSVREPADLMLTGTPSYNQSPNPAPWNQSWHWQDPGFYTRFGGGMD